MVYSVWQASLSGRLTGAASLDLNTDTHSGTTGTRILKLRRSYGVRIGRVLPVIWRKPLTHAVSNGTRLTFSIERRM